MKNLQLIKVCVLVLSLFVLTNSAAAQFDEKIVRKPLRFANKSNSATVAGTVTSKITHYYIFRARKGQTIDLHFTAAADGARFDVYRGDEEGALTDVGEKTVWTFKVKETGNDYTIVIFALEDTAKYTLKATIK